MKIKTICITAGAIASLVIAAFASDLTIVDNFSVNKAGITLNNNNTMGVALSTTNANSETPTISTNDTTWATGAANPCYLNVRNLASTTASNLNWIRWGSDGTNYPNQLMPGQSTTLMFVGTTVHYICKTNTTLIGSTAVSP